MFRFIMNLFGKEYEPCKSCEILREELAIAHYEKDQLQKSLIDLLKPKVSVVPDTNIPTERVNGTVVRWDVKRRQLEQESKQAARSLNTLKEEEDKIKASLEAESNLKNNELEKEMLGDDTNAIIQASLNENSGIN